jgi:hypothetical protein
MVLSILFKQHERTAVIQEPERRRSGNGMKVDVRLHCDRLFRVDVFVYIDAAPVHTGQLSPRSDSRLITRR